MHDIKSIVVDPVEDIAQSQVKEQIDAKLSLSVLVTLKVGMDRVRDQVEFPVWNGILDCLVGVHTWNL